MSERRTDSPGVAFPAAGGCNLVEDGMRTLIDVGEEERDGAAGWRDHVFSSSAKRIACAIVSDRPSAHRPLTSVSLSMDRN